MNIREEKLQKIFNECNKHLLRINSAYSKMFKFMPLDKFKYTNLNDDEIEHIDQFLFRFTKLQDTMGEKLFKILLRVLDENIENRPFIDILNKLEKLEILEVEIWRKLRDIRNELSYNYDDDPEEMSIALNKIYNQKEVIENIYLNIVKYYDKIKL